MKTLCYFESIFFAIIGKNWYSERYYHYDKKYNDALGEDEDYNFS